MGNSWENLWKMLLAKSIGTEYNANTGIAKSQCRYLTSFNDVIFAEVKPIPPGVSLPCAPNQISAQPQTIPAGRSNGVVRWFISGAVSGCAQSAPVVLFDFRFFILHSTFCI
jgi:hypothetical protein